MKLSDYLQSLVGKEITQENIRHISSAVDEIKINAVTRETTKLQAKIDKLKEVETQLKKYQSQEQAAQFKET